MSKRPAQLKTDTNLSDRFIGELNIPERRRGSAPAFTSLAATSNVDPLASRKCFVSTKSAAIKAVASALSGCSIDASNNRKTTSAAAAADSSTII
jgi:hypothetical protein